MANFSKERYRIFYLLIVVFYSVIWTETIFSETGSSILSGSEPDEKGYCRLDFSAPNRWRLDSGEGSILSSADGVQGSVLQVKGNGQGGNRWIMSGFPYGKVRDASRQGLCLFRFKARATEKVSGSCMAGSLFSFQNFNVSEKWESFRMIFPVSERIQKDALRLILYSGRSTFQFAEAEVLPVFASFGPLGLTSGEELDTQKGIWSFQSQFKDEGGSWSPALKDFHCVFNSNRWHFGKGSYLTYSFQAPGQEFFYGGSLALNIGYYSSGSLLIEFSTDGKNWEKIGEVTNSSRGTFDFSKVKTKTIWFRFRGNEQCGLQMDQFRIVSNLSNASDQNKNASLLSDYTEGVPRSNHILRGKTIFWEMIDGDPQIPDELLQSLDLPQDKMGYQTCKKDLRWKDPSGKECAATIQCRYLNYDYYREDYGYRLNIPDQENEIDVWWTDATHKIWPDRKIPEKNSRIKEAHSILLTAAANDLESSQLVLYPKEDSTVGPIHITDFISEKGERISAQNVEIRRVYYHYVQDTSDLISPIGLLPDALPPFEEEVKIAAKTNFPIWLTVFVPSKTIAGDYSANLSISLRSGNDQTVKKLSVPIKLHVWNFELPVENTIETAFGFNPELCWKYHQIQKETDRVKLLDKYFRLLGRNRISVYNPIPFTFVSRKYIVDKDHPEKSYAVLDFKAFDEAFELAMKKYHFNRARLTLPGMGGGTFVKRIEPEIAGHKIGSPVFEALFASVVRQTEQHLIEKGWIDKFYLYWFDEPEEKDYPFVRDGMRRVKKYAPRIRTMLTEEPQVGMPGDGILGKVDIWAMIIDRYHPQRAEECRVQNEVLWTYMTNVPTPYCTQFMEHSASDLRIWLWQSWKYRCPGILIWTINYWTSATAFPDHPQNPYLDPGTYQTGYGLAKGTKKLWGNGDARLVYPPLSCATVAKESNFEDPVPSIRLEMIREGIEDYEMLVLLQKCLARATDLSPNRRADLEKLLTVPNEITSSWTSFSTDPAPIYRHRKIVAEAIEELIAK